MAHDDRQLEKRLSDLPVMQAIYSAIELGVIERLAGGRMTAERISEAIAADPRATLHLLRLLAEEGIVQGLPGREWTLTDFGARLRPDAPRSLHGMVMSYIALLHPAWQQLRLSERIRAAMPPQGVLLVVDIALPDDGSAPGQTATSLNLLALFGVTLRTVGEYRALLGRAGLVTRRSDQIADTDLTLFEAVPTTIGRHP